MNELLSCSTCNCCGCKTTQVYEDSSDGTGETSIVLNIRKFISWLTCGCCKFQFEQVQEDSSEDSKANTGEELIDLNKRLNYCIKEFAILCANENYSDEYIIK